MRVKLAGERGWGRLAREGHSYEWQESTTETNDYLTVTLSRNESRELNLTIIGTKSKTKRQCICTRRNLTGSKGTDVVAVKQLIRINMQGSTGFPSRILLMELAQSYLFVIIY